MVANHIPIYGPDGKYSEAPEDLVAAFTRFENHEGITSLLYGSQAAQRGCGAQAPTLSAAGAARAAGQEHASIGRDLLCKADRIYFLGRVRLDGEQRCQERISVLGAAPCSRLPEPPFTPAQPMLGTGGISVLASTARSLSVVLSRTSCEISSAGAGRAKK